MPTIGKYTLTSPAVLAPMAGVTDLPFRRLCRHLGAGLVVGEMIAANPDLRATRKSRQRLDHSGEPEPVAIQIAGGDPESLAECARYSVAHGAHIVDINMGCPAKKVCNKAAGSALMKDECLVRDILQAVVEAVDVPVTLKMRTGWEPEHRNADVIATLAEELGIQSLAIHGRTRACGYKNTVEYDTIRAIKQSVSIPVFANGDITSPQKAVEVMDYTGADGVLIGRAAQGNPWIFRQINHFLATGAEPQAPRPDEIYNTLRDHLQALYAFYGDYLGLRIARKHVGWYLASQPGGEQFRRQFNQLNSIDEQGHAVRQFFLGIRNSREIAA
tara:strand:- start:2057 stop:3046 length:990 start_codon:yes stop_codon:yes gene_type:complete